MKDPYEVLGVSRGADKEQVKTAYRALAKKYHPDQYAGSPLEDLAKEKMQEINEAYDSIMSGNHNYSSNGSGYGSGEFSPIEDMINNGRLDEAERMLDRMNDSSRPAHWYYLKGRINYMRGWTSQAETYFRMANMKDPGNPIYANAYNSVNQNGNGGFRTHTANQGHSSSSGGCCGCDSCDLCTGLICADCCCECFGGDLISCC